MKQFLCFFLPVLFIGCLSDPFNGRDFSKIATSTAFAEGKETGNIEGSFVKELSGLAPSRRTPGCFWTHNDGKKVTELYLIDSLGKHRATCKLPLTETQDCEDIAISIDPATGISYIYLADIGDNNDAFPTHFIYRIPEPDLPVGLPFPVMLQAQKSETITFQYPDAALHNAETVLFDPRTQDMYIVTKAHDGATLFRLPYANFGNPKSTLEPLCNLPIDRATAGCVSPDGSEVLIKTKSKIYYWKVAPGQNLADALQKNNPELAPYQPEAQGEAVCFNLWGTGFYTSTERVKGSEQPLFYYVRN